MKKIYLLLAVLLITGMYSTSCTAKKNLNSSKDPEKITRVKEDIDKCEEMSNDISDGKLKAYGSAIDQNRDFARQSAILNARGELAASVKALVTNVFKTYRSTVTSEELTSSQANRNQTIDLMAQEVISNSTVLCSERYALSNGTYEYVVCIGMVVKMEEKAKEVILGQDEILKVQFNEQNFRDAYKKELDAYKEQKKAN